MSLGTITALFYQFDALRTFYPIFFDIHLKKYSFKKQSQANDNLSINPHDPYDSQ